MGLSVSHVRVRERLGLSGTEFDSAIAALIWDTLPALEHALRPEVLGDDDPGLRATLNLAALEIVAGEFAVQLAQQPGWGSEIAIGEVRIGPPPRAFPEDPTGWKRQGWERLRPYLKYAPPIGTGADVRAAGGKRGEARP